MNIFVISLTSSIDRQEFIKKQMDELDIPFHFFDAVSVDSPEFSIYQQRTAPDKIQKQKGYQLTKTEIACFASHYKLWGKCVELNEPIIILEDNAVLSHHFQTIIHHQQLPSLIEQFKFILLSVKPDGKFPVLQTLDEQHQLIYDGKPIKTVYGTTGYAISPATASVLIKHATEFIYQVDEYMDKTYIHGITPTLIYPRPTKRASVDSIKSVIGDRKDKSQRKIWHRPYIEFFRLYEYMANKIARK